MASRRIFKTIGANIIAWIISIILITPLILILINSLKTSQAAAAMDLSLPDSVHLSNFITVIQKGKLDTAFLNSLIYSVFSVLLCTLTSSMAAYVLSRNRSKANRILYFVIVLGITMPLNFIALMKVMQMLQIINTRIGIILLYASIQTPFNVFLIYSFVGKIPRDIDEAAIIDGCSPLRLFFSVVFPLLKPVLVTVMVLTFLNTWNEYILPLYYLGNTDYWPMTEAVYNFFGMYFKDWNLLCADIVLTSLPVIVVYLLGQKYIVSGMTAGAVKG
jgi:raffinose/stachyose/melibiose transport system permease protein